MTWLFFRVGRPGHGSAPAVLQTTEAYPTWLPPPGLSGSHASPRPTPSAAPCGVQGQGWRTGPELLQPSSHSSHFRPLSWVPVAAPRLLPRPPQGSGER